MRIANDLTGKVFGNLTAIEKTTKRTSGFVVWKCKCTCGEIVYHTSNNLLMGRAKSCGCQKSEFAKENGRKTLTKYLKDNLIDNTRIDIISKKEPNKNSTTGYRGVWKRKKDGKYIAHIQFKKKKYFLGSSSTIDEAIEIRKKAEENLTGDFLKWYENFKENR